MKFETAMPPRQAITPSSGLGPRLELWAIVFAALTAIAWLLPDHFDPWPAFRSDLCAALALGLGVVGALLSLRGAWLVPAPAWMAFLFALLALGQGLSGQVHFFGDALLAATYLGGLGMAVVLGCGLQARRPGTACVPLWWALTAAALASALIALVQWMQIDAGTLPIKRLAPGARPYGNFGQPNQLATALLLGLISALLLYQERRLGRIGLYAIATVLALGIVLSGSRAGLLAAALLAAWLVAQRGRAGLKVKRAEVLGFIAMVVVWIQAVPVMGQLLLLDAGTQAFERPVAPRLRHWAILLDAVAHEPWLGYGWNQVSVAVARHHAKHLAPNEWIEYSHNLALDLMVWNGVVVAALALVGLAWWWWQQSWQRRDAAAALMVAMPAVAVVHAMFEFPLAYAYFLLPIGFIIGVLEAGKKSGPALSLSRAALGVPTAALAAVVVGIAIEYVQVEENAQALRLESARIGSATISEVVPTLHLLTQQRALLAFARSPVRGDMSDEELEQARKVAERFGKASVLSRMATLEALSDHPQRAQALLQRLCNLHSRSVCESARANWSLAARTTYPKQAVVTFPAVDEATR
jgi:hypothetical protein